MRRQYSQTSSAAAFNWLEAVRHGAVAFAHVSPLNQEESKVRTMNVRIGRHIPLLALSVWGLPLAACGTAQDNPPAAGSDVPAASSPTPVASTSAAAIPTTSVPTTATTPSNVTTPSDVTSDVDMEQPSKCDGAPALAKPRIWRLTYSQIENTLRDQFGFVPPSLSALPGETRLDGFANQSDRLTISPLTAETYFAMGKELGTHALANPERFGIACDIETLGPGACLEDFINHVGQKLWRRPLTTTETLSLAGLFSKTAAQGEGGAGGVASVLQALFMSPNFLHRTELGEGSETGDVIPLTDHELASSLSYLLWDSAPDEELVALANEGKLRDRDVLLAQARRLFETRDRAAPAIRNFLTQWLYLENLDRSVKDPKVFPLATAELPGDLQNELELFLDSILFEPGADRSFKTLFTAEYTFVNERTAPLYGISDVTGEEMVRRDLDPAQRRGIISMAPFLWGHSHGDETNLVGRGAYFRGQLLCERVPLPEGGVPAGKFPPPGSTGRQKFTLHSEGGCKNCHTLFDGIGFSLENYDATGQWRTTEYGQTIDPTGALPLPSEGNVQPGLEFSNFVDLVDQLEDKPDVYDCFAQQFASYAAGRDIPELDECEKEAIIERFAASNYKIDELVMSIVASSSFVSRKN